MSLGLPNVEETTSWGEPALKAHGKLWVWWSPHEDAPVFKVPFEERDIGMGEHHLALEPRRRLEQRFANLAQNCVALGRRAVGVAVDLPL